MQQPEKEGNHLLACSPRPFHPKDYLSSICLGFDQNAPRPNQSLRQTEKINIAMGFDAGYAIHSLTTLASIFGTTQTPQNLEIYLLHSGELSQQLKDKFLKLAPSPAQIHFMTVDDRLLETLPIINDHITLPTYYRLLLADLIDESKILWIDGDTIICDDIANLWQVELENFLLAAVPDTNEKEAKERLSKFYKKLGKDPIETYVNCGVSLYNLDLIREKYPNLLKSCQEFVDKYPDVIQLEDQDLLNLLAVGKIKKLPLKWNLYASFYYRPRYLHYFSEAEVIEALQKPSLIHYAARLNKPWEPRVRTRLKGLYWYWRQKTGLPPRGLKERIAKMLSPCYYLEKNNRYFLQAGFGLFPWVKISWTKPERHLGKWQGFFL